MKTEIGRFCSRRKWSRLAGLSIGPLLLLLTIPIIGSKAHAREEDKDVPAGGRTTSPSDPAAGPQSPKQAEQPAHEAPQVREDRSAAPAGEESAQPDQTPAPTNGVLPVEPEPKQVPTTPAPTNPLVPPTAPPATMEKASVPGPAPPRPQQPPAIPPEAAVAPPARTVAPPAPPASAPTAPTETVHAAEPSLQPVARAGHFGVGLDLGVSGILPDAGLLLTGRPIRPVHVQFGAGFNGFGYAIRGGLTLINPYLVPVSLTWEGGHYFEGDANRAVHWFSNDPRDIVSLKRFSYDYMNLLAGIAFEGRNFSFYLRGGVTWMYTTIKDFQQSVNDVANTDLIASDPKIRYRGPTLKLGVIFFL